MSETQINLLFFSAVFSTPKDKTFFIVRANRKMISRVSLLRMRIKSRNNNVTWSASWWSDVRMLIECRTSQCIVVLLKHFLLFTHEMHNRSLSERRCTVAKKNHSIVNENRRGEEVVEKQKTTPCRLIKWSCRNHLIVGTY